MRVIAGRWGGRLLTAPRGLRTRPTTDRVREALFSILGTDVPGAEVADLCCGSGALGIEALSRGATRCTFVDRAPAALRGVRANLERLGAAVEQFELVAGDAAAWLRGRIERKGPVLVLADPPYDTTVAADLLAILAGAGAALVPTAVLEHASDRPLAIPADLAWTVDVRRYGHTGLTILRLETP